MSTSNQGSQLFIDEVARDLDANGIMTGATQTISQVTSGFSFTLPPSLAGASVSGSGLPATTCTYDANFNQTGCTATTIDATVTWTGLGPISRSVSNSRFGSDGIRVTEHISGTLRSATATGMVAGLTLSASDSEFAQLGITKSGSTEVCIGSTC